MFRPQSFLLVLATVVAICGCNSSSPTSPTTVVIPPAAPVDTTTNYTLSGEVFEMTAAGRVPVEGVSLYCDSCGSEFGHTFTDTDANGAYSFGWSRNGAHPLLVRKDGYSVRGATGTFPDGTERIIATVNGDTRFDVEVVRR
jgi:hypothetical protein